MEEHHADDQSHYEISLTAGQAFLAFVLLLLSLAATFSFGLMIGRGQADERLVVRREPSIVTEGSVLPQKKSPPGKIVELGVEEQDFKSDSAATETASTDAVVIEEGAAATASGTTTDVVPTYEPVATAAPAPTSAAAPAPVVSTPAPAPKPAAPAPVAASKPVTTPSASAAKPSHSGPAYAQLLSTTDQKRAESLAARLIDASFMGAYVERGASDRGTIYRVRVKFSSETDARAALPKLKEYSPDAWIDVK